MLQDMRRKGVTWNCNNRRNTRHVSRIQSSLFIICHSKNMFISSCICSLTSSNSKQLSDTKLGLLTNDWVNDC